jgi:hypothetical protein
VTVLSRRAAGACLVAGPALWLSTSVFDRVGTGAGTRVAFFSSWPELAGLTVLVLLTALLLQALAERLLLLRGIESDSARVVLGAAGRTGGARHPFSSVDRRSTARARCARRPGALVGLDGGRWSGVVAHRHDRPRHGAAVARARPAATGAAGTHLQPQRRHLRGCCLAALTWSALPGGDEPHYLVVTQSLLTDHDLAIANNHARGDYLAYYQAPLKPDYRATGATA